MASDAWDADTDLRVSYNTDHGQLGAATLTSASGNASLLP